jgi:hypothetical protein
MSKALLVNRKTYSPRRSTENELFSAPGLSGWTICGGRSAVLAESDGARFRVAIAFIVVASG